jgi:hypothetical protein
LSDSLRDTEESLRPSPVLPSWRGS